MTLIGATTENPYYEVNSALISRTQVYELESLTPEEMAVVVRRGLEEVGGEASDEVVELIAHRSGGDARTALNIVELAHETADGRSPSDQRRGRGPQAAARLRQGRRRALRLHLRLHQVDAR